MNALNKLFDLFLFQEDFVLTVDDDDFFLRDSMSLIYQDLVYCKVKSAILMCDTSFSLAKPLNNAVHRISLKMFDKVGQKFTTTDKAVYVPSELIQKWRYPCFLFDEQFCPEDAFYLWAAGYRNKIEYLQVPVIFKEYCDNGISANYSRTINANPYSMLFYHLIRHSSLPYSFSSDFHFYLALNKYFLMLFIRKSKYFLSYLFYGS
jgi:hypothetical protein